MIQQAICKERLNAQAPAQKKAHSKLFLICVAICCMAFSVRAEVASEDLDELSSQLTQIYNDLHGLKVRLVNTANTTYNSTIWQYDGSTVFAMGGYVAVMETELRNIGRYMVTVLEPHLKEILSDFGTVTNQLQKIDDNLSTVVNYVSDIDAVCYAMSQALWDICAAVETYLPSLDNVVKSLRSETTDAFNRLFAILDSLGANVDSIATYVYDSNSVIKDIYNSISAGINVSLSTGFPEIPDYTSILESIRDPFFTGWVSGFTPVTSYIAGGVVWSNSHTLDRNTSNLSDVNATGNFFTDVLQILSQDNRLLSSVNKSLMLLCGTNDNTSADSEVSEMESSVTDLEAQRDSALSAYEPWRNLQFQDVHEHLDASHFSNLKGMGSFPGYVSFEVPAYRKGVSSSFIEINLNKVRGFIDFLRNLVTWVYWGLTVYLVWFVFKIFLKMVDKVTSIFSVSASK